MDKIVAVIAGLVALAAGGFGIATVQQDSEVADPAFGMSPDRMQRLSAESPAAAIVLPMTLPPDYGWAGVGESEDDGHGAWSRTIQFVSVDGRPTVELCAKAPAEDRGCAPDDDPAITRELDGLRVRISFEEGSDSRVDAKLRSYWEDVELTTDYPRVSWLDR